MKAGGKVGLGAAALAALALFVASHEGFVPKTYLDPIGIPTICYGHTGPDVQMGRTATKAECEALLQADLAEAIDAVDRCIPGTNVNQKKAFASATFNAGPRLVCGSTLQRYALAGNWAAACAELSRWVYAGGKKLPGLVRRRAEERALCETPP